MRLYLQGVQRRIRFQGVAKCTERPLVGLKRKQRTISARSNHSTHACTVGTQGKPSEPWRNRGRFAMQGGDFPKACSKTHIVHPSLQQSAWMRYSHLSSKTSDIKHCPAMEKLCSCCCSASTKCGCAYVCVQLSTRLKPDNQMWLFSSFQNQRYNSADMSEHVSSGKKQ